MHSFILHLFPLQTVLKLFKTSPPEVRLTLCRPAPGTYAHTHTHTDAGSAPNFLLKSVFYRSSSIHRAAYWHMSGVAIINTAPASVGIRQLIWKDVAVGTEDASERSGVHEAMQPHILMALYYSFLFFMSLELFQLLHLINLCFIISFRQCQMRR